MDLKFKDNSKLKVAPFTQLEYIENTGAQYIDSGILTSTNLTIEFEASNFSNNKYTHVIGARVASSDSSVIFQCGANINLGACIQYKSSVWSNNIIPLSEMVSSVKTKYTVVCDNNSMKVYKNDVYVTEITDTSTNFTPLSLVILGFNANGTISPTAGNCKLYSLKIKQNNIVVRDFAPVKDENNIVCLYDAVSKQFFYNAGTGDFIAGTVVKQGTPETILIKTTTLYHKNTPNVDGLQLLNGILNYQKTHQDEVKEYYYPTTQLWQDIIAEYPDIIQYYNMNHKLCIPICEADDPEQFTEDLLQLFEDYPDIVDVVVAYPTVAPIIVEYSDLIPIIAENPDLTPIIAENPEVVHSLVDTGYETGLTSSGTQYIDTGISFPNGFRIETSFKQTNNGTYYCICGAFSRSYNNYINVYSNKLRPCVGDTAYEYGNILVNSLYKIDVSIRNNIGKIIINDTLIADNVQMSGSYSTLSAWLFALHRTDSTEYQQFRGSIGTTKLYDKDNNLVLWLVPIQNNSNPCMIDLITGTKYLNQGTGSFTYSLEPKNA